MLWRQVWQDYILTSSLIFWPRLRRFHVILCCKSPNTQHSLISEPTTWYVSLAVGKYELSCHLTHWHDGGFTLLSHPECCCGGAALFTAAEAWSDETDATCCKSYSSWVPPHDLPGNTKWFLLNKLNASVSLHHCCKSGFVFLWLKSAVSTKIMCEGTLLSR